MQRNASMAVRHDVHKIRTEILSEGLCTQNGSISLPHASKSGLVVVGGRKVCRPYFNGSLRNWWIACVEGGLSLVVLAV